MADWERQPLEEEPDTGETLAISVIVAGLSMMGIGLVVLALAEGGPLGTLAALVSLIGWVVNIVGCGAYTRARGFPGILGVLGVTAIFGACLILCLPKRVPRPLRERRGFEVIPIRREKPTSDRPR